MLKELREKDEESLRQAKLDITTGRKMMEKMEEIVVARQSHAESARESYRKEEEAHAQLAEALNIERLKVRYRRNRGSTLYLKKFRGKFANPNIATQLESEALFSTPSICDNLGLIMSSFLTPLCKYFQAPLGKLPFPKILITPYSKP